MRITVLANRDLASCLALNYLLPALGGHSTNVFLSSAVGGTGSGELPRQLRELKFMEQQLFNELLFPLIDAQTGKNEAELRTFKGLSEFAEQDISELNAINEGDGLQRFAASAPDLVLSVRYGSILREPAIAVPDKGVLNLHSGKLPGYRGVMASFWALLGGEETLGTTLHYICDAGIDTGPVIDGTELRVVSNKSYLWHVLALYRDGCEAMLSAVKSIAASQQPQSRSQPAGGNYFSFPTEADLQEFEHRGLRLFDAEDAVSMAQRFMAPWAGA